MPARSASSSSSMQRRKTSRRKCARRIWSPSARASRSPRQRVPPPSARAPQLSCARTCKTAPTASRVCAWRCPSRRIAPALCRRRSTRSSSVWSRSSVKRRSTRSRSMPCSRTSSATPHPRRGRACVYGAACPGERAEQCAGRVPHAHHAPGRQIAGAARSGKRHRHRRCGGGRASGRARGAGAGKADRAAAGTVRLRRAAHAAERKNTASFRL